MTTHNSRSAHQGTSANTYPVTPSRIPPTGRLTVNQVFCLFQYRECPNCGPKSVYDLSMAAKRARGSGSISWLDTGRARLRVRIDGERRSKVIHTSHKAHGGRGEAAAALEAFMDEIEVERADAGPGSGKTIDDLMDRYIAHCKRTNRKQGTLENYEMTKKRLSTIGTVAVRDLGTEDLDTLYGELESRKLSDNSIRQTHAVLRAALNQAMAWKWITENPAEAASPPKRHRPKRAPLPLTDVARMVATAGAPVKEGGAGDHPLAMAIALSSLTGARRGELCGLRWDDIDKDACSIRIERQWVPGKGGQYLTTPKSADGDRTVFLGVLGLALIERYRDIMRDLTSHEPVGWLLSPFATEKPMRAKSLGLHITKLGQKLNLDVTTHSFRRVSAVQLVAANIDVATSAGRMGHTREVMLADYVVGADDRAIAAAETLEARFVEQGFPLAELLPYQPKES